MKRLLLVVMPFLVMLAGCLTDDPVKTDRGMIPSDEGDGWAIRTLDDTGLDASLIENVYDEFYREDHYYNALALLIAHEGYLVAEGYTRDEQDRHPYDHVMSVTKSFTSLLLGFARDEGYLPDLDATLDEFLPERIARHSEKGQITLRHLLTMRSGIDFDNTDFSIETMVDGPGDLANYILGKPLFSTPGDSFYYRDCDPALIGTVLNQELGESLEHYAVRKLFTPLGIENYHWMSTSSDESTAAFGLFIRPRDLLKVGQFVLQKGMWDGQQILSSAWIDSSTANLVNPGATGNEHGFGYGYYWWVVPELNAFTAWGHGGTFVFIVPEKELVIVMVSMPDVNDDVVGTTLPRFLPLARLVVEAAG